MKKILFFMFISLYINAENTSLNNCQDINEVVLTQ